MKKKIAPKRFLKAGSFIDSLLQGKPLLVLFLFFMLLNGCSITKSEFKSLENTEFSRQK